MELAFAVLQQLCAPLLDRLERLPAPQRHALEITFGLSEGPAPDRFFVGLAVLGLLAEAAEERPLLCVIDDAQWLDRASAQALAFVARRLLAESVVMLFAVREPILELAALPELVVEGLRDSDARQLLTSVVPGRLDQRVVDQLVAEARGNPLALLELPRGLTPAELAGGFGLPEALPLQGRIEDRFVQRLEALPADTRRLLLVAAADPTGDPALVWRAAARLGLTDAALEPARRRRSDRDRRSGPVPPSAGALRGLPCRSPGRASPCPRGAGGSDRPAGRSRPARLASRRGDGRPGRVRRRRARASRRPRPGARRTGRRGRLPRARRGVDAGPCPACAAGVGGGTDEVRGRGARRRSRAPRHRGDRRRR